MGEEGEERDAALKGEGAHPVATQIHRALSS